ncbi:MAG: helix-turn-helix domain-containing protein [Phocaeicola sp.]|nr:helix-turn-helix domain-containing protein [Phocaeicola sp.]
MFGKKSECVRKKVASPGTCISLGFYAIMLADGCQHKVWYGQRPYDFSAGNMLCIAPHQVITIGENEPDPHKEDSWGLFFHPDLIRRMPLGNTIGEHSFFSYQTNEALHLSHSERATLRELLERIRQELQRGIDRHTQTLIVSNIELMLNYCKRYYERQFITRSSVEGNLLERFESILTNYMQQDNLEVKGLPSVSYLAEQVQLSASYMSDQLRQETGLSPQEHIHRYIIELAKTRLLSTQMNVSELAYSLGFEYPQYFSRLFKAKTGLSPLDYRRQYANV